MQENRSFDHYFGTFPGARGFSDPTAIRLPTGRPVFQQPDPANPDGYLEPWHMSTITSGAAAVPSLSHDWREQHASWNQGAMDGWLLTRIASDGETNGSFTMGHYTEEDIPFHWALAKAFTLADNYHCSVMGPTDASTRRPSRRPAPSSSPPSWRPWPPTRNCGTAPCSSPITTRTTGSSTT
jgi:phospholipase C